jgi:hypothetical protein
MIAAWSSSVRTAILSLVLACIASGAACADLPSLWRVKCGGPFQTCGYVDRDTAAVRIGFRFEAARPFRDGLAPVRIDGRWGYIDPIGKVVIAAAYAEAAPFYGKYAEVRLGDAAGVIDRTGRLVVPARFKRIVPFTGEVFVAVSLIQDRATRSSGGYVGPDTDPSSLTGFGSAGLYHLKRGWITERDLQFTSFDSPARGLIWASRRNDEQDEVWGLMRADGSWQVTPRYSYVQKLIGGRAIVRALPDKTRQSRDTRTGPPSGAVDEDGKLVVPLQFAWLGYWRAGYGLASRVGGAPRPGAETEAPNAGLVTPNGALLAGRYFDAVDVSEDGALPRVQIGKVWHSVSPRGDLLPDKREGMILLECPGGLSFVRRAGGVEARRPGGAPVGLYDDGDFRTRVCPGPFSLRRDDKWFLLMPDGALLGGEAGFRDLYGFTGDTAAVKHDGKWGVIDRLGRYVMPPRFDEIHPVGAGAYQVRQGGDTGWIDAAGHPMPKPVPPRPDPVTALTCEGGLTLFQANGRWGLKAGDGKVVVRPEHRVLTCFRNGFAWAVAPEGQAWCPIGPDGARRSVFRCRQEVYPVTVSHHLPEKFAENPFESSVLWNLAQLDYLAGTRPEAPRWLPDGGPRGSHSVMEGLQPERNDVTGAWRSIRPMAPYAIGLAFLAPVAVVTWRRRRA